MAQKRQHIRTATFPKSFQLRDLPVSHTQLFFDVLLLVVAADMDLLASEDDSRAGFPSVRLTFANAWVGCGLGDVPKMQ